MANEYKIDINKREDITRQGIKKLRKEGNIPGVYYSSSSKESTPIFITHKSLQEAIKSGARIFNISVNEKKQNVLFKAVQYHPVTDEVLHIDLYGVRMDQAITIKIPLYLKGDAVGVKEEGGIVNQPLNEVEIQCLPGDIPDFIELDITELSIGDSLSAGDITLDGKFTLATSEDAVAVSVTQPMQEIEPEVAVDEDESFLDEDGEEGADDDTEKSADGDGGDKKEKGEEPEAGSE